MTQEQRIKYYIGKNWAPETRDMEKAMAMGWDPNKSAWQSGWYSNEEKSSWAKKDFSVSGDPDEDIKINKNLLDKDLLDKYKLDLNPNFNPQQFNNALVDKTNVVTNQIDFNKKPVEIIDMSQIEKLRSDLEQNEGLVFDENDQIINNDVNNDVDNSGDEDMSLDEFTELTTQIMYKNNPDDKNLKQKCTIDKNGKVTCSGNKNVNNSVDSSVTNNTNTSVSNSDSTVDVSNSSVDSSTDDSDWKTKMDDLTKKQGKLITKYESLLDQSMQGNKGKFSNFDNLKLVDKAVEYQVPQFGNYKRKV